MKKIFLVSFLLVCFLVLNLMFIEVEATTTPVLSADGSSSVFLLAMKIPTNVPVKSSTPSSKTPPKTSTPISAKSGDKAPSVANKTPTPVYAKSGDKAPSVTNKTPTPPNSSSSKTTPATGSSSDHVCSYKWGPYTGWFVDNNSHYKTCTICGKEERRNHYEDKNKPGYCGACGVKLNSSSSGSSGSSKSGDSSGATTSVHSHTYPNGSYKGWEITSTTHYKKCTKCDYTISYSHTRSASNPNVCATCGVTLKASSTGPASVPNNPTSRTPSSSSNSNSTNNSSSSNGSSSSHLAHTYKWGPYAGWYVDNNYHYKTCTICGKEKRENHYEDKNKPGYCGECGVKLNSSSSGSSKSGGATTSIHTHVYPNTWQTTSTTHYKKCTKCNSTISYSHTRSISNPNVCATCGLTLKASITISSGDSGSSGNSGKSGSSGNSGGSGGSGTSSGSDNSSQGHTYPSKWQYNNTFHYKKCNTCFNIITGSHVTSNKNPNVCSVCGMSMKLTISPTPPKTTQKNSTTSNISGDNTRTKESNVDNVTKVITDKTTDKINDKANDKTTVKANDKTTVKATESIPINWKPNDVGLSGHVNHIYIDSPYAGFQVNATEHYKKCLYPGCDHEEHYEHTPSKKYPGLCEICGFEYDKNATKSGGSDTGSWVASKDDKVADKSGGDSWKASDNTAPYDWALDGYYVATKRDADGYGEALDIPAPEGTDIHASHDGKVVLVYNKFDDSNAKIESTTDTYGNFVVLYHEDLGTYTLYAHIKPGGIKVSEGDLVTAGTTIGEVGHTGEADGDHLHQEVIESQYESTRGTSADLWWSRSPKAMIKTNAELFNAKSPITIRHVGNRPGEG